MKVTRIEGKNLACFREFDLNLGSGPIADASIFAIVGRTGSGKSTILDAVCLALYGTLPRVDGMRKEQRLDLKGGYVTGTPIAIVRRGSSSAYAACEFVAHNGRSYRAVWSVRSTSRGGSRGDLVLADPTLHELGADGKPVGNTSLVRNVTERDEQIGELVGLSEPEFRRAALLAQNDFAAFLHADPKKRAELLEKITGASEYAGIGKKVTELGMQAERKAKEAARVAQGLIPFTDEDERAAILRLAELKASLDRAQEARQALVEERRLASEMSARRGRLADRQVAREAAWKAMAAEAPRAERLRLADLAEGARPAWDAERIAVATRRQADLAAQARDADALKAAGEAEGTSAAAAAREREASNARVAHRQAQSGLALARGLDERIRAASLAVEEAESQVRGREVEVNARAEAARRSVEGANAARSRDDQARRYLEEHRGVGVTLDRCDPAQLLRALGDLRADEIRRARDQLDAGAAAGRAQQAARVADGVLTEARRLADVAANALGQLGVEPDLGEAVEAAQHARDRRDRGLAVMAAEDAVRSAQDRLAPKLLRREALDGELRANDLDVGAAEARAAEQRQELAMAERVRDRARVGLSMNDQRAALTDGEPCPLCGSTAHPWAAGGAPPEMTAAEAVVAEVRAGFEATGRELEAARGEGIRLRAEQGLLLAELPLLRATHVAAQTAVRTAHAWWGDVACPAGDVLLADLEAADARVVLLTAVRREWALARANVERTQQAVLEATRALAPLASALAAAESAERQAGSELERASAATTAAVAGATAALATWPTPLELDDVSAALALVQAATIEWRQAEKTHAELSARLPGLTEAVRTAGVELEAARAAQADLEAERSRLLGHRGALLAERAGVLEGRAADEVERELQTAVDVATAAAGDALARQAAALERSTGAAAEAELARGQARRAAEEARAAGARLDACLAGLTWTREELESSFLDHGARELARTAVHQASEALRLAEAAQDIAEAEVAALVLPLGFDPSTLEERAAAADVAIVLADDARSGALAEVTRRREEGERQREAQAEKLRLEAVAEPWKRLRDLIGGDSFRRLAQSRSVDALVELANQQLAVFARRYTLQRHEDADLDLHVCDEESGDEIRGTESLSGGETFLVSLALALALGRLSSRSVNVQTLFIDEGFGALDSESVEPVIDALRKISAGGTQIGVISHVPVVAERVDALVTVHKQSETSKILPPVRV